MNTDIIVIGAGIIGCAIAKELSRHSVSVVVLESGYDVADGATKANSGIIHAGYDARPGTTKAKYNVLGAKMFPELCNQLGVDYNQCGALVLALTEAQRDSIVTLFERGLQNGVENLKIIEREEILSLEPNVNPDVLSALFIPTSAIVSPYEVAFALADNAAINGVSFKFDNKVECILRQEGGFCVKTLKDKYYGKVIVNCAGASGTVFHNQLCDNKLSMIHRRGQYYLLDRVEKQPFERTIFQCPSNMGKGVLITPTIHGNLIIGPTAEDICDPLDTSTTAQGLKQIIDKARLTWPQISVRANITNFSGIRAHLEIEDFLVGEVNGIPGAYEAIGIDSPGLSSAPAIAEDLCRKIVDYLGLEKKKDIVTYNIKRKAFRDMCNKERAEAVRDNPSYGNIICRCEMVTEAEIRESINRPVGAKTVDGVKRRTRAGMGRCQGGFCLPRVASIIAEETGKSLLDITKNGGNSYLVKGTIEDFLKEDGVDD